MALQPPQPSDTATVVFAKLSAVVDALNGLAGEPARAEAFEALLTQQDQDLAAAVVAAQAIASALFPADRPGDAPAFFTTSTDPGIRTANAFPALDMTAVASDVEGACGIVQPSGYLASREFHAVEPGRTYAARTAFGVLRTGLNEVVNFGLLCYGVDKAPLPSSPLILFSGDVQTLTTLDFGLASTAATATVDYGSAYGPGYPTGRIGAQYLVTRAAPAQAGAVQLDPATRYIRPFVQNPDPYQLLGVEVLRWSDVTDATIFAPSVQGLSDQLQAEISRAKAQEAAIGANFGARGISDASYQASASDNGAAMVAMTTARTITLPPLRTMLAGKPFAVWDESGAPTSAMPLTVAAAGSDLINGSAAPLQIETPFQMIQPRAGLTTWLL